VFLHFCLQELHTWPGEALKRDTMELAFAYGSCLVRAEKERKAAEQNRYKRGG
jgi:hypothetical protein